MKKHFRSRAPWLTILALTLLVVPAFAQVPQDMTYTGRLVNNLGNPLVGPVNLELRIFDAETGPTQLYSEEHSSVSLDATGGFSVQLGTGPISAGTFDAALFSEVGRWMEVVVNGEVLTPRQIIGSVPWAFIAQQANKIVPDPFGPFEDCGDGTVADPQTGLQWEKKTGTQGSSIVCNRLLADCPDPHVVNNTYRWSFTGTDPDGGAFTNFTARLNDPSFGAAATLSDVTGCLAGQCDWRLPTGVELMTIQDFDFGSPTIDPIFGPTYLTFYWTASTHTAIASNAWAVQFNGIFTGGTSSKMTFYAVRGVRTGACR